MTSVNTATCTSLDTSPSPPPFALTSTDGEPPPKANMDEDENETEDEEVKMNCMNGVQGIYDSDMDTTEDESIDGGDDDDEDDLVEPEKEGVVTFIRERTSSIVEVVRPQATSPAGPQSSPFDEEGEDTDEGEVDNEDSDDASIASSVGGPSGVPVSTVTSKVHDPFCEHGDRDGSSQGHLLPSPGSPFQDPGYHAEREEEEEEDVDEEEEDPVLEDEDAELFGIMVALTDKDTEVEEEESESTSERHIGVVQDRVDFLNVPKTKRVLSFNTLAALNSEIGCIRDSPKRSRGFDQTDVRQNGFSSFSLGPPAAVTETGFMGFDSCCSRHLRPRLESPLISSSDDEALDRQLEEELGEHEEHSRDNSPVPLLTPPDSPLTIEINGDKATFCEWPSNLIIDSALAAAVNEIRPLSPASFDETDEEEEEEDKRVTPEGDNLSNAQPSTLTPMLRGISVAGL